MAPSATSTDFTPRPFPKNVPIIPLPRISLAKLRSKDNDEIERLWDACKDWGFFYLDLQTSQEGKDLILDSEAIHQAGVDFFTNNSVADKSEFKTHPGHLDTGYKSTLLDDEGNAKNLEFINVSQHGLFNSQAGYELTPPLNPYKDVFMEFMKSGHSIACLILNCLEGKLKLPTGTLDQLHGLSDSSGDFLRILRYPAPKEGAAANKVIGSAHTDAMSVAMLFNWQGGLQLSCVNEDGRVPLFFDEGREPEDSWFYVEPVPGHAICNLGDAMKVFSNGLLKSGKHRVVTPPGDQGTFDRYSVLLATRPADNTIMKAMKSPEIPAYDGDDEKEGLTAKEWGMIKVQHLLKIAAAAHQKQS